MKKYVFLASLMLLSCLSVYSTDIQFEHRIADQTPPKDPWVKVTGDINGDGKPDILIAGRSGPTVWYANPDWKKTLIGEGDYQTVDGAIGDIDRDGDMDVVIGAAFWYENPQPSGDPAQGPWKAHKISDTRTHDIELADLDGDGDLDLIARDQSGFGHNLGNKIHFWRQDKPDAWTNRVIDCPHGEGLTTGDIDRDGDIDIIAGKGWYENTGDIIKGPWTEHVIAPDWHQDTVVQLGDINGDGYADVVLTRSEGPYKLSWFQAPADPKQPTWPEHSIDPSVDFAHSLKLADMDRDGDLDVITAEMHQSERHRVLVYLNENKGGQWKTLVLATTGSHALCIADFNQDGLPDIMGSNWSGNFQPIELWINSPRRAELFQTKQGDLLIHPVQHASFVLQWNDKTIYVDPVGGANLYAEYPKADLILITHDHGDHLNEDTINGIKGKEVQIVVPSSVYDKLSPVNQTKTIRMANGSKQEIAGIGLEAVPMYNLTPDRLRFHPKGLGNGYVLTLGGKRVYIAGDTEDTPEMLALKNIDIAFVCMNLPYTMTPQQAADAVRAFQPKVVYPYHSRGTDVQKFKELVGSDQGIDVRILQWYP